METTSSQQAQSLALEFSRCLRAELSASNLATVIERNAVEAHAGVCHSHDFCDANMTMLEAFERSVGREIDLQSDADTSLWNAAWRLAKASQFAS